MHGTAVVLLGGGSGSRMKDDVPKQFAKVAGKTILEHTVEAFERHPMVAEILIVVPSTHRETALQIVQKNKYRKVTKVLNGGATRQESSAIGASSTDPGVANVLVHDAVRPFVSASMIERVIRRLEGAEAVDTVIPTADTIVRLERDAPDSVIAEIPDRRLLRRGQTPQGFRRELLLRAHQLAKEKGVENASDDCGLIKRFGLAPVHVVEGDETNLKVTYPQDLYIADRMFQLRTVNLTDLVDARTVSKKLAEIGGKVIVVFGGSSGIGQALVERADRLGAHVESFSRNNGGDVTDAAAVTARLADVAAKRGRIDAVVNTSGILKMSPLRNASFEEIEEQVRTNLIGSFFVAKAALPHLVKTRGSLVLYTSSSYTRGRENYSPYSSSKAAIVNMTQALAEEFASDGIRVNVICPERTSTPMRWKNFGVEPPQSLVNPHAVALVNLLVLVHDLTGQVVDVRKKEEHLLADYLPAAATPPARPA